MSPSMSSRVNARVSSKPPLLALLGNPQLRDRIQIAFRMGASPQLLSRVAFAADWGELGVLTARHPGSPAVIDTLIDGPGHPTAGSGRMRHADDRSSSLPVIWYAACDQAAGRQLRRAGTTCETRLVPKVSDDFDAIDRAILRSIDAQRVHRLRESAREKADPAAFEMLDHALDLATGPCPVPDLAARVGRTRRTLEGRCAGLGIPTPRELIAMARIFTVHRLAEWSRQPFSAVARALGFPDRSNYRRLVRGTLGCAPSMIQRWGGSEHVARQILTRLER